MDKTKKQLHMNLDNLFGPKDPSSSSSSSSAAAVFGFIFPHPSTVGGRDSRTQDVGRKNNETQERSYLEIDNGGTSVFRESEEGIGGESSGSISNNQNETVEASYYSSSIYYGGQENYSQRGRTTGSHPIFKKDGDDDDPNGNTSNSASRGNWWQGSLYY